MKATSLDHERDLKKKDSEVHNTCTKLLNQTFAISLSHPPSSFSLCPLSPSQREIVVEELDHISEEHQQLSSTFAAQSAELARVEGELRGARERLAVRETELARMRQRKERRASVSKVV